MRVYQALFSADEKEPGVEAIVGVETVMIRFAMNSLEAILII